MWYCQEMKYQIQNLTDFKKRLLHLVMQEWSAEADIQQQQMETEINSATNQMTGEFGISPKEQLEQQARLSLSLIRSAVMDLKKVADDSAAYLQKEMVHEMTLFDLEISSKGSSKTTTYFVVPVQKVPKMKFVFNLDGVSVTLVNKEGIRTYFGQAEGARFKSKGGEVFEEPHMGHYVSTGRFEPDRVYKIKYIYR